VIHFWSRCIPILLLALAIPACAELPAVRQLIETDHWKRARAMATSMLAANPNDADALTYMSTIEESFLRLDSARTYAEKAVAKNPVSAAAHAQLARVYAVMAETAPMWKQVVLVRNMKRELEAVYRSDPKNVDALLVEIMFTFKAPAIVGGSRAKAHAIAQKLLAADADWGHMAEARLAQFEDAEPTAIKELSLTSPSNYVSRATLANVYCCLSKNPQYDPALRIAKQLRQQDPGRPAAYEILAQVYAARGEMPELDAVLVDSLHNVPDNLSPYYLAARTLMQKKKDPARAETYLRKYLSVEPEGRAPTAGEAHWTLGLVLGQLGRKDEALAELRKAEQMRPDLGEVKRDLRRLSD
jgi:tetratricopeptide (TPR) repeat protein